MQSYKPCHARPNIIIPNHTITFHTIPYTSIPTWTSKTEGLCTSTVLRKDKLVTGKRYNQSKAMQGNDGKVKPAGPNHNAINQVFASHALHCRQVKHPSADVSECVKHFVLQVLPSPTREQVRD